MGGLTGGAAVLRRQTEWTSSRLPPDGPPGQIPVQARAEPGRGPVARPWVRQWGSRGASCKRPSGDRPDRARSDQGYEALLPGPRQPALPGMRGEENHLSDSIGRVGHQGDEVPEGVDSSTPLMPETGRQLRAKEAVSRSLARTHTGCGLHRAVIRAGSRKGTSHPSTDNCPFTHPCICLAGRTHGHLSRTLFPRPWQKVSVRLDLRWGSAWSNS